MQGGTSEVNANNAYNIKIGRCGDGLPNVEGGTGRRGPKFKAGPQYMATLTPKVRTTRPVLLAKVARSWKVNIAALRVWNRELPLSLPAGRPVSVWLVKPYWVTVVPTSDTTRLALLKKVASTWKIKLAWLQVWNNHQVPAGSLLRKGRLPEKLRAGRKATVWLVKPFL